jgi:tetraacyldisaccharide 4'-kinase
VVLIDATLPFGGGHMLPRGLLREPLRGLRRTDFLVITRSNLVARPALSRLRERLEELAPGTPVLKCGLEIEELRPLGEAPALPLRDLPERRVLAFCGIGNPDGFRRTLLEAGCEPAVFRPFADHEAYGPEQWQALLAEARAAGCEALVCTEKDAVKVERLVTGGGPPVYATPAKLSFGDGRSEFVAAVLRAIGRMGRCEPA